MAQNDEATWAEILEQSRHGGTALVDRPSSETTKDVVAPPRLSDPLKMSPDVSTDSEPDVVDDENQEEVASRFSQTRHRTQAPLPEEDEDEFNEDAPAPLDLMDVFRFFLALAFALILDFIELLSVGLLDWILAPFRWLIQIWIFEVLLRGESKTDIEKKIRRIIRILGIATITIESIPIINALPANTASVLIAILLIIAMRTRAGAAIANRLGASKKENSNA